MEAKFEVGEVITTTNPSNVEEWEIIEVTDKLVAVRPRSSGVKIEWFTKSHIVGQISVGAWKIKNKV